MHFWSCWPAAVFRQGHADGQKPTAAQADGGDEWKMTALSVFRLQETTTTPKLQYLVHSQQCPLHQSRH